MKYTIEQIEKGEDELLLKYRCMNPEIESILHLFHYHQQSFIGTMETEESNSESTEKLQFILKPHEILYFESVDNKTFAYTNEKVLRLDYTLIQLEHILTEINFFRCSKSMILNIDKVVLLKSLSSNRIDATMCNGEHIIISRTYASDFRRLLKRACLES